MRRRKKEKEIKTWDIFYEGEMFKVNKKNGNLIN